MSGRKIDGLYEHPLDNIFIEVSEKISPTIQSLNMTPNMITFLSLIFGILAIWLLVKNNFTGFAICYLISYFFDCTDGYIARKYKMTSKFGDYFDHIKDVVVFLGIFIVVIFKYKSILYWYEWIMIAIIIFLSAFGMVRHLGCQEKHYSTSKGIQVDEKNSTLSKYASLCPQEDVKNEMRTRRWLGCGNFILTLILLVGIVYTIAKKRG